jgi:hypothetical protein
VVDGWMPMVARGAGARCWLAALAGVVAVVFVSAAAASASAATPLRWSAPVLVDTGVPRTPVSAGITGMSCPVVSLCVGVDSEGTVMTTTDPGANRGWRLTRLRSRGFAGVSCPTVNLCVAVDVNGNVWSSTSPTGGSGAWTRSHVDSGAGFTAVSCPTASLCVAIDDFGGKAFVSTNPAAGAGAWAATLVEPLDKGLRDPLNAVLLSAISCPSASLCVAVDSAGQVLTTTNPTGGEQAWTRNLLESGSPDGLVDVSCPSVSLCVAVDDFANVFRSTDPTSGNTWVSSQAPGGDGLNAVTCPAVTLCVFGDVLSGGLYTLTQPGAGLARLRRTQRDATNSEQALSCPSTMLCVAGDSAGNISIGEPQPIGARVPTVSVTRSLLDGTSAKRVGHSLAVDPGLAVRCPAGGPSCIVTGKALAFPGPNPSAAKLIGRLAISVRVGRRRELKFLLDPAGAQVLIKNKFLFVILTVVARDGHGAKVAEQLDFGIAAPGQ